MKHLFLLTSLCCVLPTLQARDKTVRRLKEEAAKNIKKEGADTISCSKHNPQNIDLFMTNVVAIKLNRFLTANWNLDFIYDDDFRIFGKEGKSPALQLTF